MSVDPTIRDHKAWIGYLQPDGLVVSAAALVDSQVVLDRGSAPLQHKFQSLVEEIPHGDHTIPAVTDLKRLLLEFLEWPDDCLYGLAADRPIPESLKIPLREFGETLEPTIAFGQHRSEDPQRSWLLLLQDLPAGTDLDEPVESKLAGWSASPTRRFERLLRESQVSIGLLSSGTNLRLLYAPRGENSGTLTFPVAAMTEIAGRPILAAFRLLLSRYRLLAAPTEARLPALLKRSRDYQSRVSTALAGQVLDALYELLRGFQAADDHAHGELLKAILASDPDQVYAGLLSVLMRLVFLLYAEDKGLMPGSDLYVRNYAVHGLFERLRTDAEQYPDTMEHRYGAWAQLAALFRAVHRGCNHPLLKMPARQGHLFDPNRYPFLEGRAGESKPIDGQPLNLPVVPDGTIHRVLEKLLVLDGERLSYRTLDVEQIGSVYETMMGFRLERAAGTSIALKPAKAQGAPVPVNLDKLLAIEAGARAKSIADETDYKLPATMASAVKDARSIDDLMAGLERRIARNATPQPIAAGKMVLIPTDERRKSGSHYTPRSLTQPIVQTTLKPILEQLASSPRPRTPGRGAGGEGPTPEQILSLKICDPAMGSGAFLVEVCRQLAEALVEAWHFHNGVPMLPPDEDEVLQARRLIAQHCLYGVDKNPMAVDLSKLSLWLATLAKDHPFTFLDHSLRCGDSLVGLSREQIAAFHWQPPAKRSQDAVWFGDPIAERMRTVTEYRQRILAARDDKPYEQLRQELDVADEALSLARLTGDCVIAAYFSAGKDRERVAKLDTLARQLVQYLGPQRRIEDRQPLTAAVASLHGGDHPLQPFHWQIEFPEVFTVDAKGKPTGGFDAIVGNPPFAGKNTLINGNREGYLDWLKTLHDESHGNADLVAHFFRRAFGLLRAPGRFVEVAGSYPESPVSFLEVQESFRESPESFREAPESFREAPESFREAPESFREAPESFREATESFREALESFREASESFREAPESFSEPLESGRETQESRRKSPKSAQEGPSPSGRGVGGGCFGLIATNTIGQGDTRSTGLRWICTHGGTIYAARKRLKWPGQAAVVVSVVNVCRGAMSGPFRLDGRNAPIITAYLFHAGGHDDPEKLKANEDRCFQGSIVLGLGFTFDESDTSGVANPLSLMHELIAKDRRNADRIFPYINGEEVNSTADHRPTRHVIDFFDRSLEEAAAWPDLLNILRQKVMPERARQKRDAMRERWWHYAEKRPGLYRAVQTLSRVIVRSLTSANFSTFTFLPRGIVYDQTLIVFIFDHCAGLVGLCSRVHEAWTMFFGGTLEDRPRYNIADCFETFPFPTGVPEHAVCDSPTADNGHLTTLETAGREYYEFRAALMVRNNEGLTKTYNRFHDPHETSPDILQLRALHAAMDRAVLEAYGWHDLAQTATCEFLLDYEDDEDEDEGSGARSPGTGRQKKKPWRYRWPDPFRDEVLARLLELNKQRAEEERRTGAAAAQTGNSPTPRRRTRCNRSTNPEPELLE